MGRRRASAPSPLVLRPANVPLRRGQPKFVLPSPPSSQALHVVGGGGGGGGGPSDVDDAVGRVTRCTTRRRGDSVALKEMPRLELGELLRQAVERGEGFGAGSASTKVGTESEGEEGGQRTGSSTGSSVGERMGLGVKPWSGKDAVLPQIAVW